jgi:hypothetical protein
MKKSYILSLIVSAALFSIAGCEKEQYSFGTMKTPENLTITTVVEGANTANPDGNGTGRVSITANATNALTYRIDYGDGKIEMLPSGKIVYKYSTPGTKEYTITISAVGTGGVQTVASKKIKVFVRFEIPADIVTFLTNNASKKWATDKEADGHFGVSATDVFFPLWYSATPNSREACAYDDEITFTKDASGNITMVLNNKGASFSIGAATGVYGFSGPDGCYPLVTTGTKNLTFFESTSASTSAVSRRIDFAVPGNGMLNFGTGGKVYEILSITATQLHVRSIGADGNAWYMKLKSI